MLSSRELPTASVPQPPAVLTIAGSDSGGAAGAQADLKTWTALGVYGMSVLTAVTAQNSIRVTAVHYLPPDFITAQLDTVLGDYRAAAAKTGFIGRADAIARVAQRLRAHAVPNLVIDPVLVNHRGESMFPSEVTAAYVRHLLPLATLVTPNLHEAALLCGEPLPETVTPQWQARAARWLHALGAPHVLVKGGRGGGLLSDVLYNGRETTYFCLPRIATTNIHGSGDTLSAAICAGLARGESVATAVRHAQQFTAAAIQRAAAWRLGQGHGPLCHFLS